MYEQIITSRDEGQRLDKYLNKLLPNAGTSFLYKMLRKKNITLNGKKAAGTEKLADGDSIKIFFSDETLQKFMGSNRALDNTIEAQESISVDKRYFQYSIPVVYEDENVLFLNKPAGILSQKATSRDYSVNDWIIDYLYTSKELTPAQIKTFRPAICNRLDRNTSGLILCAKTLKGAQYLAEVLKNRTAQKFYLAIVHGKITNSEHLKGYLKKDERTNMVTLKNEAFEGADYIETAYSPLYSTSDYTLLKVHLITGKTHQIRAHLSHIGHPILGDVKYGAKTNDLLMQKKITCVGQMLHAWEFIFPPNNEFHLNHYLANPPKPFFELIEHLEALLKQNI